MICSKVKILVVSSKIKAVSYESLFFVVDVCRSIDVGFEIFSKKKHDAVILHELDLMSCLSLIPVVRTENNTLIVVSSTKISEQLFKDLKKAHRKILLIRHPERQLTLDVQEKVLYMLLKIRVNVLFCTLKRFVKKLTCISR